MFAAVAPSSPLAFAALIVCFVLVLAFEFSNGFHDTADSVATVIYTHSLKLAPAVVLSGVLNFLGVGLGGVAVALALVELPPPDVLTPPNGNPAIAMLLAFSLNPEVTSGSLPAIIQAGPGGAVDPEMRR